VRDASQSARETALCDRSLRPPRAIAGGWARPAVVILALASAAGWPARADAAPAVDEAVLKATYLYKFAQFVEWPDPPPAGVEAPLYIAGSKEFARRVEETLREKSLAGRPLVVRFVAEPEEAASCRLFFVTEASRDRVDRWLAAVGTRPVLTIGEQKGFAARGGMINLTREGRKLRFEINQAAAERAGLRVSSQLLKIARAVADAGRWD